jgi:hypothetical protein
VPMNELGHTGTPEQSHGGGQDLVGGVKCQLIITSRTEGSEDRIGNRGNSVIVSDSLIEMISN